MLYSQKNDDGIELHVNVAEREILYKVLEHYAAVGKPEEYIVENMPKICQMEDVLFLPEFNKK